MIHLPARTVEVEWFQKIWNMINDKWIKCDMIKW